jgi:DNA-binding transcriptional LysR family regulator
VAVLPALTVKTETANGTLAVCPFEEGRHFEPLGLIWRKAWKMSPAAHQFIRFLKQPEGGSISRTFPS